MVVRSKLQSDVPFTRGCAVETGMGMNVARLCGDVPPRSPPCFDGDVPGEYGVQQHSITSLMRG